MSKNRNFHDVRSSKKALFYGSARAFGPFRPQPKKRKPAAAEAATSERQGQNQVR